MKRSSQYVDHPLLALISEAKLNKKFDFNEEKEKNIRKNLEGIGFIRIFATEKINQIRIFMKG